MALPAIRCDSSRCSWSCVLPGYVGSSSWQWHMLISIGFQASLLVQDRTTGLTRRHSHSAARLRLQQGPDGWLSHASHSSCSYADNLLERYYADDFLRLLATKSNPISKLTGIPHERLQLWHQWLSWAMFALALIHTFPFIVYNIWKGTMVEEWKTSIVYWTGVIAILAQAWLTLMSIGPIR